jgi:hypothetical protein
MEQTPRQDQTDPEVLYHYTSMETMLKIVERAELWASSINYLNDTSEGDHFLTLVRARLPDYLSIHQDNGDVLEELVPESATDSLGFEARPYVVSLSVDGDSLPQWRSYCTEGNGVAVGLRVECLRRAFLDVEDRPDRSSSNDWVSSCFLKRIDYVDASHLSFIDPAIEECLDFSKLLFERHPHYSRGLYFKSLIQRIACFTKQPSFRNENEYRLLVDQVLARRDLLRFRPTRSTLRPYIPVKVPKRHSSHAHVDGPIMSALAGRWDFIDRVVIGPTPSMPLSVDAVSSFFKAQQLQVQVEPSSIPFRDW